MFCFWYFVKFKTTHDFTSKMKLNPWELRLYYSTYNAIYPCKLGGEDSRWDSD